MSLAREDGVHLHTTHFFNESHLGSVQCRFCQSVNVRACGSAIAHVRAVFQVRKGCEASWNCACEVRACGGVFGVRSQVR